MPKFYLGDVMYLHASVSTVRFTVENPSLYAGRGTRKCPALLSLPYSSRLHCGHLKRKDVTLIAVCNKIDCSKIEFPVGHDQLR